MTLFFVKQKTAYEMRIRDWSSDVCSSDLDDELAGLDAFRRVDDQHVLRLHCGVQHKRKCVRQRKGAAARRAKRLLQIFRTEPHLVPRWIRAIQHRLDWTRVV